MESWVAIQDVWFPGGGEGGKRLRELVLVGEGDSGEWTRNARLTFAVKTLRYYDDLLPHVRRCFAYCCLFSKGEEMSKDLLIELWMANGFIPSEGDVSLYVLGEEIFTCLAQRSFFQDVVEEDIDTGASCKMHDLMHDLAQYVMIHDCVVIEPDKELITSDELPKGLRYMRNLQRLDLSYTYKLRHMPVGIKELTNLRRLFQFVVGKDDGARIGELGNINLLGSELMLSRLENVGGLRDAKSANLKDKTNLKSVILEWSREPNSEVLEGLEPNSGLQQLTIWSYMGTVLSLSWLVKLVNLTSIGFAGVDKCEQLPPLGKLPSLKLPA
ncbi:disease resistance protein [Tanacetum coccineum]